MRIYLDNAATTRPCEPAVSAAFQCMAENFGNPSSLHKIGLEAEQAVTEARKAVASAIVTAPECVFFTSGATESNNTAVFGIAKNYGRRKKRIVTTSIEHPSIARAMDALEEPGVEVVRIAPDRNGFIDADDVISAVDENTCLVSCMLVNNETGLILPIRKIFSTVKRNYPECITHCDAVQGFMKIPTKMTELYADVMSLSAHKIHGIKGVGALAVKKGVRVAPLLLGGGQEKGIRSGTESVPLIVASGAAVRALQATQNGAYDKILEINNYLRGELAKIDCISVNSPEDNVSPYILNFSVEGIRSEIMLHYLEHRDIFVSSGSACSKGAKSSVLAQFRLSDKLIDSAVRVSFSRESQKSEADALLTVLKSGIGEISKITNKKGN